MQPTVALSSRFRVNKVMSKEQELDFIKITSESERITDDKRVWNDLE